MSQPTSDSMKVSLLAHPRAVLASSGGLHSGVAAHPGIEILSTASQCSLDLAIIIRLCPAPPVYRDSDRLAYLLYVP